MGAGADEGVVEEGVGAGDLVEGGERAGEAAAEGVGGDEFGDDEGVAVEVGLVHLRLDLLEAVEVAALVELGEVELEDPTLGGPSRRARGGREH